MGIYRLSEDLKILAINTSMVNQSSAGDIQLYNNSSIIKYPFVNFDVVSSSVIRGVKRYKIRIYVCDRNNPYIAYNKTELILDNILKNYYLDISTYIANYFTLDFMDLVNGVWADFELDIPLESECLIEQGNILLEDKTGYVVDEDGNFIKQE